MTCIFFLLNPICIRRKKNCVSTNPTDLVSNARLCYFLSVKMQNKKVKHRPLTKHLYFHKITGPTLFFSGEKNRKIKKKKFLLPTNLFFFGMLVETQLFFTPYCPFPYCIFVIIAYDALYNKILLNPFIPEFLKWTFPFLNLDLSTDAYSGYNLK